MIKVKSRILTDVEQVLDLDIEDRNVKREILEDLARKGYKNTKIEYLEISRIDDDDVDEIDLDFDLSELGFMYGKPQSLVDNCSDMNPLSQALVVNLGTMHKVPDIYAAKEFKPTFKTSPGSTVDMGTITVSNPFGWPDCQKCLLQHDPDDPCPEAK